MAALTTGALTVGTTAATTAAATATAATTATSTAATSSGGLARGGRTVLWTFTKALGQGILENVALQEPLNIGEVAHVVVRHQGDGHTVALGAGGTTYAVYIVLGIAGHVVVDDAQDVVDVNTTGYDVSSHEYVDLSGLETIHHVVALSLREVGVHSSTVDVHALQLAGDVLHLVFLA